MKDVTQVPFLSLCEDEGSRLIEQQGVWGYRYRGFWQCMDTFKDKQKLEDLNEGSAPWKVWNHSAAASPIPDSLELKPAGR